MKYNQNRGKLMPPNMKKQTIKSISTPSMIGPLKPYHIRYKSLRPTRFRLDPETFKLIETEDDVFDKLNRKSKKSRFGQDAQDDYEDEKRDPNMLYIQLPPKKFRQSRMSVMDVDKSGEELLSCLMGNSSKNLAIGAHDKSPIKRSASMMTSKRGIYAPKTEIKMPKNSFIDSISPSSSGNSIKTDSDGDKT